MNDPINRADAIKHLKKRLYETALNSNTEHPYYEEIADNRIYVWMNEVPPAQPERLTDDDFETIRIHLSAYKERLCNQHRWKEAEEYQRIIDRFMRFASAQPERKKMTNKEWLDFLSEQFDISRTSARGMLHGMMQCKKEDNYKKQFNRRWEQE